MLAMKTSEEVVPMSAHTSRWVAACRPTVLFLAAYALAITPHEIVHGLTTYLLGYGATIHHMWVDPDASGATPGQLATIAVSGPIFSLALGVITWAFYRRRFRQSSAGLILLMLAIVGIYSFLGPLAGSALGGDFNRALTLLGVPRSGQLTASVTGFVALPIFMFFMGWELVRWRPATIGRFTAVASTTIAPWVLGAVLTLVLYWPLPSMFIGNTLSGGTFWVFAIVGALLGYSRTTPPEHVPAFTKSDLIVLVLAVATVRFFVHGVRLSPFSKSVY